MLELSADQMMVEGIRRLGGLALYDGDARAERAGLYDGDVGAERAGDKPVLGRLRYDCDRWLAGLRRRCRSPPR